ncbi:MAG: glutamate racemase [Patescibacteria group bacterium]|nr:glutamate racemase [Patescibacteria group bacterium]
MSYVFMIGVFDSGVGGLTVLKSLLKHLPDYDYVYLGDNARTPYGNKTKAEVYEYTRQAVDFLFSHGCDIIIVACNTASALALRKIQQEYLPHKYPGKKVLGVVRPMAEAIAANKKFKRVGVIGTKATIKSKIYPVEIKALNPGLKIFCQSAPLLVPLIESGWNDPKEVKETLEKYLAPLKKSKIDLLVLGCTHYPFLEKQICQLMGKHCKIYNSGEIVAKSLKEYLTKHKELAIGRRTKPKLIFYTTGGVQTFKILGDRFLGKKIEHISRIALK